MTQQTPQTVPPEPEPELTGVRNFRDVGGLPTVDGRRVRRGRLYRSGHLAHTTDSDAEFLASLGLHTILDFRNAADIRLEGPDVELPGVRHVNLPLSDPASGAEFWGLVRNGDIEALRGILGDGKAAQRMIDAYVRIVLDRTKEHGRMLDLLVEEESVPTLLHCAAGKDRAGTSVAIILLALGVERDAIMADYLASNAAHRRYRVQRADGADPAGRPSPEVMELLNPLFGARAEYLATALDTIESHWGSVDAYLSGGLDLTPDRRERLRELFLED